MELDVQRSAGTAWCVVWSRSDPRNRRSVARELFHVGLWMLSSVRANSIPNWFVEAFYEHPDEACLIVYGAAAHRF